MCPVTWQHLQDNIFFMYILYTLYCIYNVYIFWPQVEVPPSTLRFYSIIQWSCSAPGSLWEMLDSNPGLLPQKSGALPNEPPHPQDNVTGDMTTSTGQHIFLIIKQGGSVLWHDNIHRTMHSGTWPHPQDNVSCHTTISKGQNIFLIIKQGVVSCYMTISIWKCVLWHDHIHRTTYFVVIKQGDIVLLHDIIHRKTWPVTWQLT